MVADSYLRGGAGGRPRQHASDEERQRVFHAGFQSLDATTKRTALAKALRAKQVGRGGAALARGADEQVAPGRVEHRRVRE
jgi:hypothetical protein